VRVDDNGSRGCSAVSANGMIQIRVCFVLTTRFKPAREGGQSSTVHDRRTKGSRSAFRPHTTILGGS
jgi:hypothetical protein